MTEMRPAFAIQVCLALFQSFLLAPVQHVHETPDADLANGHEHSVVIHSHFSPHVATPLRGGGAAISDYDGPEAWPLNTFTLVLPMGMHAVIPSPASDAIYTPQAIAGAVVAVDERTHDPPALSLSIPRAPPA